MIPFVDLKSQYLAIKPEIDAAVMDVLETSGFILGKKVAAFETEFAKAHGATEGIGTNSGTSALHLALLAAGVGSGDEVITTPFTFVATTAAIGYCNARPVFVDITPESFTIDPSKIEAAITPRTKAIIPVHLYGQPADMDSIMEIARKRKITVIEDACQAHLARYKDRPVGSIGDLGAFSFYPGKNLGAYGEGGAIVTSNASFAKTMRMLRDWGQEKKYYHDLKGFNYRMEGIQGAILGVKLKYLAAWTEARRKNAALYAEAFKGSSIVAPAEMSYARHVFHVYAIRSPRRDAIHKMLTDADIQSGIHYPIPIHMQKSYADLGHKPGDFPHAEKAAAEVLSLPMFPELTPAQIAQVADVVKSA
ncbi:MAG: DegT/DnrJ/EryC1/StrS family aminotransferase [Candidatus Hydrogenedentota bacterium]